MLCPPCRYLFECGRDDRSQVQQLNEYYDHVCTIDKAVSAVADTIAASLAYTGSSRVLAASNAAGTQLFSVTLPMATAGVPGLTTTRAVTNVQKALNTRVKELGNFLEETAALNALRDPSIWAMPKSWWRTSHTGST